MNIMWHKILDKKYWTETMNIAVFKKLFSNESLIEEWSDYKLNFQNIWFADSGT